MKSRFRAASALLLVAVLLFSLSACRGGKASARFLSFDPEIKGGVTPLRELHRTDPASRQKVASDGRLTLYYEPSTASVSIGTSSGAVYDALPVFDNGFSSVFSLTLVGENGRYILNSQDHSVAFSAFEVTYLRNGVRVLYRLSDSASAVKKTPETLLPGEVFVSVSVEYVLSSGKLQVSVDCADIFVSDGFVLESMELLPYFGATAGLQAPASLTFPVEAVQETAEDPGKDLPGEDEEENGGEAAEPSAAAPAAEAEPASASAAAAGRTARPFLLVPDGPGAVAYLDTDTPGEDVFAFSADPLSGATVCDEASWFGLSVGGNAFAALVEEGADHALVRAFKRTANSDNVNLVYPAFTLTRTQLVGRQYYYGELYRGKISVAYLFLSSPLVFVPDLAAACREELIRTGVLPGAPTLTGDYPLNVAFVGALGARTRTLTTYAQIEDLAAVLKGKGLNDLNILLLGGFSGGYRQSAASAAAPAYALGGRKGFLHLIDRLHEEEIRLYVGINAFTSPKKSGAQYSVSGQAASVLLPDPVNNTGTLTGYILKEEKAEKGFSSTLRSLAGYAFDGFLLQDAEASPQRAAAVSSSLRAYKDVALSGGALSRLSGAALVTDVALETVNPETASYAAAPFLPSLLHGLLTFSGEAPRSGDVLKLCLLKSVEYGAAPAVCWVFRPGMDCSYENTLTEVTDFCAEAAEALADLSAKTIEGHEAVVPGVYKTTFSGGIILYVNYNNFSVNVGNVSIPPYDYLRLN